MSTSCDQRLTIPRQRDRVTHRPAPPAEPSLLRQMAVRYLVGAAEAAGVVTVGAITYVVLTRVVL